MTQASGVLERPPFSAHLKGAGFALGFALGGFFDGILLHQILQWHHLLSGVEGAGLGDLRVQVLADGVFHALMYVIAALGLWLLWRVRGEFGEPGADRQLAAFALIGFGVWHVVDGILSHWVLGIHRIRMDVGNPLLWDLLWFFVFGVALIAAGWYVGRGTTGGGGSRRVRRATAPLALALAVLLAAPVAALPPRDVSTVMVLFRPGMSAAEVLGAIAAVDGRTVWSDRSGQLWAIEVGPGGSARQLYRHGALLVGSGLLPAVCFTWSRA
jgi:uncharacterized membrane protein